MAWLHCAQPSVNAGLLTLPMQGRMPRCFERRKPLEI